MSGVSVGNDCYSTYNSTLLEVAEKENKTGSYLNIFNTMLLGLELHGLGSSIDVCEINCEDLLQFDSTIPKPSQGAVGFCVGQLGNSIATKNKAGSTRVVPTQFYELPDEGPGNIISTGKVIPTIKGDMHLPPGMKSFDLGTAFYDPISKLCRAFSRDCCASIQGQLIGRINSSYPVERILTCYIDNIDWIVPPVQSSSSIQIKKEPGCSNSSTAKSGRSPWRRRKLENTNSLSLTEITKYQKVSSLLPTVRDNIAYPAGLTPSSSNRVQPLLDDITTPSCDVSSSRTISYTDLISSDESTELEFLTKDQVRDLHDGFDPAETAKHA
ncbi:hypothetical protein EDC01DRAFT_633415 [Geopyxis carbonaria]|nr:hypothetical protein EDC01DRAFT_633415 [Geopyxis carbonaria]